MSRQRKVNSKANHKAGRLSIQAVRDLSESLTDGEDGGNNGEDFDKYGDLRDGGEVVRFSYHHNLSAGRHKHPVVIEQNYASLEDEATGHKSDGYDTKKGIRL